MCGRSFWTCSATCIQVLTGQGTCFCHVLQFTKTWWYDMTQIRYDLDWFILIYCRSLYCAVYYIYIFKITIIESWHCMQINLIYSNWSITRHITRYITRLIHLCHHKLYAAHMISLWLKNKQNRAISELTVDQRQTLDLDTAAYLG